MKQFSMQSVLLAAFSPKVNPFSVLMHQNIYFKNGAPVIFILMSDLHSPQYSPRQDEIECVKGTFISSSTLSTCLEALGDKSVNQSQVKGNKNVWNILPCYRRFSHGSVNFYIRAYFVSFTSHQKSQQVPKTRM